MTKWTIHFRHIEHRIAEIEHEAETQEDLLDEVDLPDLLKGSQVFDEDSELDYVEREGEW